MFDDDGRDVANEQTKMDQVRASCDESVVLLLSVVRSSASTAVCTVIILRLVLLRLLQVTWYVVRMRTRSACTHASSLYAWRRRAGWIDRIRPTLCRDLALVGPLYDKLNGAFDSRTSPEMLNRYVKSSHLFAVGFRRKWRHAHRLMSRDLAWQRQNTSPNYWYVSKFWRHLRLSHWQFECKLADFNEWNVQNGFFFRLTIIQFVCTKFSVQFAL